MIELTQGQYSLNQVPYDILKVGDNVTSLVTGNKGKITDLKFQGRYIRIDYVNGNKSIQEHGVYTVIRYDEPYDGPIVIAEYD